MLWTPRTTALALSTLVCVALASCASNRKEPAFLAVDAAFAQAAILTEEGSVDEAIELFSAVIAENPTLVSAHMGVADLYEDKGDYAAAERSYARASDLEPTNFDAHYGRALMLQMLRRFAESVRVYLRALSLRPDDFLANMNLATAYLQLAEARYALPYAERAVELGPDDGPARVNLGSVYRALDRHGDAILAYQAAAERMDPGPPLLLNLADSLGREARHREMANTLDRLIEIAPSAQAWERLGSAHFRMGEYGLALDSFQRALDLDTNHFPALNGVGVCMLNKYLQSNRTDMIARRAGVEALRRSLRVRPGQPRVVDLLSRHG